MSVIAWDGECLAADKQATVGSLYVATTKIWRRGTGRSADTLAMLTLVRAEGLVVGWRCASRLPAKPPRRLQGVGVTARRYPGWEAGALPAHPHPVRYDEGQKFAIGSGRDFALAAMHLGRSADEAVRVACEFDQCCGNGVDELRLNTDDAGCRASCGGTRFQNTAATP